jgi:hypothetical protein
MPNPWDPDSVATSKGIVDSLLALGWQGNAAVGVFRYGTLRIRDGGKHALCNRALRVVRKLDARKRVALGVF